MENGEFLVTTVPVPELFGLSRFRRFLHESSLSRLVAGAASNPAPRVSGNSPDSLPFAPVAEQIFRKLAKISGERNQELVLVYLPRFHTLRREPVPTATWLERFTRKEGIPLLSTPRVFDRALAGSSRATFGSLMTATTRRAETRSWRRRC